MGLVAAADLSARLGHADAALPAQIESLLRRLGLPTRIPPSLPVDDLFAAMGRDKKKRGNALRFILLRAIGDAFITDDAPATAVKETLRILRRSN